MDVNLGEVQEDLTLDKVSSGDRPSIYTLGLATSQALKQTKMAVLMVDALGRVRLMPNEAVTVNARPRLDDEELHSLDEESAIQLLADQGDDDQTIMEYLARRKASKL